MGTSRGLNGVFLPLVMNPLGPFKYSRLPRSMRNADQNHGIDPKLIDIGINARILIGINRHWTLVEGVLNIMTDQ